MRHTTMKDKRLVSILLYIIVFTATWNVLDFLYSTLIAHTGYHFSCTTDMAAPLMVMVLILAMQMYGKKK